MFHWYNLWFILILIIIFETPNGAISIYWAYNFKNYFKGRSNIAWMIFWHEQNLPTKLQRLTIFSARCKNTCSFNSLRTEWFQEFFWSFENWEYRLKCKCIGTLEIELICLQTLLKYKVHHPLWHSILLLNRWIPDILHLISLRIPC